MNFVGVFLWIAVGAVALHYWGGYQGEHQYQFVFAEKQVSQILDTSLSSSSASAFCISQYRGSLPGGVSHTGFTTGAKSGLVEVCII